MNCPICNTEDFFEGLYGPNCINLTCEYYKGSKIKNKKTKWRESGDNSEEFVVGADDSDDDDKTLCLFCHKAPCVCNIKTKYRKASGSFGISFPFPFKIDADFNDDSNLFTKSVDYSTFFVTFKGFNKRGAE